MSHVVLSMDESNSRFRNTECPGRTIPQIASRSKEFLLRGPKELLMNAGLEYSPQLYFSGFNVNMVNEVPPVRDLNALSQWSPEWS